ARTCPSSFSTKKWSDFAREYGLPTARSLNFAHTPPYRLPLSLQESMFQNTWNCQDVYRESIDQGREAARVKLLEP
ncbi:hypothetical protein AX14_007722, partial [Amanita brunnescens Koide BX004]